LSTVRSVSRLLYIDNQNNKLKKFQKIINPIRKFFPKSENYIPAK